jgi:uncharacterized protein (UPF0332 family)
MSARRSASRIGATYDVGATVRVSVRGTEIETAAYADETDGCGAASRHRTRSASIPPGSPRNRESQGTTELEGGLLLLDAGFPDAAASRLYYAVFQAAVYALERQGRDPSEFAPGARKWSHRMIRENAALVRGNEADVRFLKRLYWLRIEADYDAPLTARRSVEFLRREAERFVLEATT